MIALKYQSNNFIVIEPEHYTYNGVEIVIPKDFESDLASIPRILWGFLPPHHYRYRMAALFHDYLLSEDYPDGFAHDVFKEIMQVTGNNKFRIFLMYNAVRFWSLFK